MAAQLDEKQKRIKELAAGVLSLTRDNILVSMRFLDLALANLRWKENGPTGEIAMNGKDVLYDGRVILKAYEKDPHLVNRTMLHVLLHAVFYHPFRAEVLDRELWNMATDMAVESVIMDLDMPMFSLDTDFEAAGKLKVWREDAGGLTAEKIYKFMKNNSVTPGEKRDIHRLFYRDSHLYFGEMEEMEISMKDFQKIAERMKADLKSFSKLRNGGEELEQNLSEATRDRYNYGQILQNFTVIGEEMSVNDEEFDYIYYTYGLSTYGNMPLVEPLEYKDSKKVKDFVIALDTSASCKGALLRGFLNKTYSILKGSENFFQKVNVHILQCDNEIRKDTKITSEEDFKDFMQNLKVSGFGGTDFRPVFNYVDELLKKGEFENLKGLIYFTDGYGIYPERMPDYRVIFAFLNEDEYRMPVPPWCMKVVIEEEELEEE